MPRSINLTQHGLLCMCEHCQVCSSCGGTPQARRHAQRDEANLMEDLSLLSNLTAQTSMSTPLIPRVIEDEESCYDCGVWDCEQCSPCGHCDDCGCEHCYEDGRCEEFFCSTCNPRVAERRDARIESYSYRPTPIFRGNGPLFMGMELEIETRNRWMVRTANAAQKGFGDLIYLKEDSSIENGFEIVTHPMDHSYAMTKVNWSTLDDLRAEGASAGDNGLHVHVSRDGFDSDGHVFRWMKFFYRNEDKVKEVARRESDQWASFSPWARERQVGLAKKQQTYESRDLANGMGRYQAINAQPSNTFEVRVFASSLDPMEVKGTLSFVASTVEYTRRMSAQDVVKWRAWEWGSYVRWLGHRRRAPFRPALRLLEAVSCAS